MRVLVCGGRQFADAAMIERVLSSLVPPATEVIHGGAIGADTLGGEWAIRYGIPVRVFHADWARDRRAAGPIRNERMLREGKPDLVVAFPGGRGTAHMVRIAREAQVRVVLAR